MANFLKKQTKKILYYRANATIIVLLCMAGQSWAASWYTRCPSQQVLEKGTYRPEIDPDHIQFGSSPLAQWSVFFITKGDIDKKKLYPKLLKNIIENEEGFPEWNSGCCIYKAPLDTQGQEVILSVIVKLFSSINQYGFLTLCPTVKEPSPYP